MEEASPKAWKGTGLWHVPYVAGTGYYLLGGRGRVSERHGRVGQPGKLMLGTEALS